jgi:primase-polymerase (primpol)-like protein
MTDPHAKTRPDRPSAPPPRVDGIPAELQARAQWLVWVYSWDKNKWTKVPKTPHGRLASTTDPSTWSTFDEALRGYQRASNRHFGRLDGIGFVTCDADPYVLIDMDHCVDGKTVRPWARPIIAMAKKEGAYIERSPSLSGVHIIGKGPQGAPGAKRHDAELYCRDRFFTITGMPL